MAQGKGNPEINKKVATSALVTTLLSGVGFYLGTVSYTHLDVYKRQVKRVFTTPRRVASPPQPCSQMCIRDRSRTVTQNF